MSETVPRHQPEIRCVLAAHALNGESPAWSVSEQLLYWVDVREPSLHRFDPASGRDEFWRLPARVGCAVPGNGGRVLLALRDGIAWLNCVDGALRMLAPVPFDPRQFFSNDGKCDPQGRFWFGPMYEPLAPAPAAEPTANPLLRFDATDRRCVPQAHAANVSNGIAWSPDGRTMYHSDTKQKTIYAYEFDAAAGTVGERRRFAVVDARGDGGPDGGAVDSEGCYWSAIYGGGKLLRFDPDGRVEREVILPVRNPTMPAFGGPDLRTVYVTSARQIRARVGRWLRPREGGIFAFEAPVPGLPTSPAADAYFV